MKTLQTTFAIVLAFATLFGSSVYGQDTAKDTVFAAAETAVSLTTQAMKVKAAADKKAQDAKAALEKAKATLEKADKLVGAIESSQEALENADTKAAAALTAWDTSARELAAAQAPTVTTLRVVLDGLETSDRESRELKVKAADELKALIAKIIKELKVSTDAYDESNPTTDDLRRALATMLTEANEAVVEATTKLNEAQAEFDAAAGTQRVAVGNFLNAAHVLGQLHQSSRLDLIEAALKAEPAATTSQSFVLPEAVVTHLAKTSEAMAAIANELASVKAELARSSKAAEATTTATAEVAAAVNAQTSRILSKEQLLQVQAYETAQSVLSQLATVDKPAAERLSHLTGIVVLRNPDLTAQLKVLQEILAELKTGVTPERRAEIVEYLSRIARRDIVAGKTKK